GRTAVQPCQQALAGRQGEGPGRREQQGHRCPHRLEVRHHRKDVLIADLDTGIDANHPDFKGRIAESKVFAGTSLKDGYGHGTHTASTIAGTGAASNGKYAGVAPGARLLVGKVCDDDGACPDSAIIAGMEWAAARHAVAVNMSLGDTVTDGTDPVSTALNRITAQTGTLFVVAAGNEAGPKSNGVDGTVGSPGSADAALTVGSTTKRDTLSYFSSQGPRLGDAAVKPDLVAPGSDIIGARADGTNMDTRVPNPRYEQASGTSMATPHVTGAVALLAQAHPPGRPPTSKRVLTSSAHGLKNLTAFQQGSGRLDIVRALKQKVYAPPAPPAWACSPGRTPAPPPPVRSPTAMTATSRSPWNSPSTPTARAASGHPPACSPWTPTA
ncbi:S8 family serine peptidase, partial [Streptomyces sp. LBUM 1478]|nr:S8 family serine peptidase [Streptomyces sp. LBUM 1478]